MRATAGFLRSAVCAALLLVVGMVASAQGLHLPSHEKVVLKNGLTVLVLEKRGIPFVSVFALVKSGSTADPKGQEGLASVTADLLRKGSKTRSAQKFAADLDFIGASLNSGASLEYTTLSAEFLHKDIDRGFELFSDALLHPTFPADEVDKLVKQNIDGIRGAKDQADAVIDSYYQSYLFSGQAYGRPVGGDELSLARVHRDDVVKFYSANYAPGNTILAVAGDFSAAEIKKKIEDVFGGWSGNVNSTVKVNAPVAVKGKRMLLVDKPDATQTYFAIGNVGISETDPDRVAIRVINTAFGGRFTSLLNEALRVESGYTYGASAFFESHRQGGAFAIASFTKNETTTPAIDLALKVLADFRKNGLTKEQLDSARAYIRGQFPPEIETSGQLAGRIAVNEFYGLDDSEVNQLEERMNAVTPEVAKRVIEKHYPLDNLAFVLIGQASSIGPAVEKYASQRDARKISEAGFWNEK